MTMTKDNIDVKETENKDAAPLTDGELENTAGGVGPGFCHRWECCECGAHGHWSNCDEFIEKEKNSHSQKTGHKYFGYSCQRALTVDPGEAIFF